MPLRKLTLPAVLSLGFGPGAFAVDDHGDTCETATALAVGEDPTAGIIDPATDEDWEVGHGGNILTRATLV